MIFHKNYLRLVLACSILDIWVLLILFLISDVDKTFQYFLMLEDFDDQIFKIIKNSIP